jgi:Ca2+-binding RTX toxin-like protein
MTPNFTDLVDLESWTQFAQGLVSFSGDPNLINNFDWSKINALTVEDYLDLLDELEVLLENFDWSFLSAQIPFITSILQQQGLPQSQIDLSIGFLNDFVAGDISLLTDAFDSVRALLVGVAPTTLMFDAISGTGVPSNAPTTGDDILTGTNGGDVIKALAGNDVIDGKGGDDILIGDAGNDKISGGAGKDRLIGRGGKDDLNGGGGKDKVVGGGGADKLKGGGGNDIIYGGKGDDTLTGNAGRDKFVFRKKDGDDVITDFDVGSDRIKIAGTSDIGDIEFTQQGSHVLVEAGRLDLLVRNVTEAEMNDADIFIF